MESKKHESVEEVEEVVRADWFELADPKENTEEAADDGSEEKNEHREEAKEYLDILLDLSDNFTNIEAQKSRAISRDESGKTRIVGPGYFKGGEKIEGILRVAGIENARHYSAENLGTEDPYQSEDPYIDKLYTMQVVDEILRADEDLRKTIDIMDGARQAKDKAKEAKKIRRKREEKKGLGQRIIGIMSYTKDKNRIGETVDLFRKREKMEKDHLALTHTRISRALSRAYSDKRCYGKAENDEEVRREMYEKWDEWYEKFLGDDERRAKINRANELRNIIRSKEDVQ